MSRSRISNLHPAHLELKAQLSHKCSTERIRLLVDNIGFRVQVGAEVDILQTDLECLQLWHSCILTNSIMQCSRREKPMHCLQATTIYNVAHLCQI